MKEGEMKQGMQMQQEPETDRIAVHLIDGVEGQCVSVNDYRICGPKPYGGGSITQSWTTTKEDVLRAFLTPDQKHEWLSKELAIIPAETLRDAIAFIEGHDTYSTDPEVKEISDRLFAALSAAQEQSK